jgi:hypothetical protein
MRLLGPAAKIVQAVTTAVTPVLEAVRPPPRRHPDDEAWWNDNARKRQVNQRRADEARWVPRRPDWLRRGPR